MRTCTSKDLIPGFPAELTFPVAATALSSPGEAWQSFYERNSWKHASWDRDKLVASARRTQVHANSSTRKMNVCACIVHARCYSAGFSVNMFALIRSRDLERYLKPSLSFLSSYPDAAYPLVTSPIPASAVPYSARLLGRCPFACFGFVTCS